MNYLGGGKLGDFIHSLIVCKYNFETTGELADIFLSEYGSSFEYSLEFTFNELIPVLQNQPWFNSLNIYNGELIDIDLTKWRNSPLLYKTNWLEIYSDYYLDNVKIPNEYKWITIDKDEQFIDSLMINRSLKTTDDSKLHEYDKLISEYSNNAYFICFDIKQYYQFPFHYKTKLIQVSNLFDFFQKISSCKHFIGNQSGPFAWASAMNINRSVELLDIPDKIHYVNDSNYYKHFTHF